MSKFVTILLAALAGTFLSACDGRVCDQEERTICDNATSACISSKCGGKEGSDYVECFEVLCVPPLCECLDNVGCAWQEPECDDLVTD